MARGGQDGVTHSHSKRCPSFSHSYSQSEVERAGSEPPSYRSRPYGIHIACCNTDSCHCGPMGLGTGEGSLKRLPQIGNQACSRRGYVLVMAEESH